MSAARTRCERVYWAGASRDRGVGVCVGFVFHLVGINVLVYQAIWTLDNDVLAFCTSRGGKRLNGTSAAFEA